MYSALVYHNSREGVSLTPIYSKISLVQAHLQRSPKATTDVKEIVVLKGRRKPKIHGYYDWVNGKLKLDKSKPVWFHNIFYGLGD